MSCKHRSGLRALAILLLFGLVFSAQAVQQPQTLPEVLTVELFPRMRPEPLTASLYTLKTEDITKYLENVLLFEDMDQYETLPYIVGFDRNASIGGPGDLAFTKDLHARKDITEFSMLVPGKTLEHPINGEYMGLEVFVVGRGVVQEFGPTQSLLITNALTNMEVNTRLTPLSGITLPASMDVKYPPKYMQGYVLSIPEMKELAGSYSVVIVSLGRRDGLKQGHVLDIVEGTREIIDPNTSNTEFPPSIKVGEVLIYSTKEKISLGLITYSIRLIIIGDEVNVPPSGD